MALVGETASKSIADLHHDIGLSVSFLTAFANFHSALSTGCPLAGFDFDNYAHAFQNERPDAGGRWFWRPGGKMLGPEHYGAAIGRLIDRIYDAGFEEDGANDLRFRHATAVAHEVDRHSQSVLRFKPDDEDKHALIEWAPSFFAVFGRHCRAGTSEVFLRELADRLQRPYLALVGDVSFLIRLAPELFAFYLILWKLVTEENH